MKTTTVGSRPTLKLTFDDKPYSFGGTIDVTVNVVSSGGSLMLRHGTLELVCESALLDQKKTVHIPFPVTTGSNYITERITEITYKGSVQHPVLDYKRIKKQKSIFSTRFKGSVISDQVLTNMFHLVVKTPPIETPPDNLIEQAWWLVAKLNIAKGRDAIVRKQVHIS